MFCICTFLRTEDCEGVLFYMEGHYPHMIIHTQTSADTDPYAEWD
jgi:hypothetical protein